MVLKIKESRYRNPTEKEIYADWVLKCPITVSETSVTNCKYIPCDACLIRDSHGYCNHNRLYDAIEWAKETLDGKELIEVDEDVS